MRLTRSEELQSHRISRLNRSVVQTDLQGLLDLVLGGASLPTQREFVFSPDRIKWYVGPVGCAKTSTLVASVIIPALLYPGSRWFVGRWTWWTLEQTTLSRFMECLWRLGPDVIVDRIKGPPMKLKIASARVDANGDPMEPSEIIFHGLDDLEKLGSTEFTGIAIDEANEIDENMASTLNMRLRHKLPGQSRAEGPFFLNFVSNPVRRSHWLHKKFCGEEDCELVPWGHKFRPQPNENAQNLPPNYYQDIAAGMPPEMRIRFVEGECGPDPAGQSVFPEFAHSLHVGELKPVPGASMVRGWDFGRRRPACVWAQVTPEGWVNRLACELGDNIALEEFAKRVLQRSATQFPMAGSWRDFVDPHGDRKYDVSEVTSLDVLRKLGIRPIFRDVSKVRGLDFMSKGLCNLIKGRPRSMYDRVGCQLLIEGYGGGYCYQVPRPGRQLKEEPHKDGFYEHLMDCDRYIEVNLQMGAVADAVQQRRVLRKIRGSVTGY